MAEGVSLLEGTNVHALKKVLHSPPRSVGLPRSTASPASSDSSSAKWSKNIFLIKGKDLTVGAKQFSTQHQENATQAP